MEAFLDIDNNNTTYEDYCDAVERTHGADGAPVWGGQLELQALSQTLNRTIEVYSADAPVLTMNEDACAGWQETATVQQNSHDDGDDTQALPPLRVSFHRHYFALGEHYNSIIPNNDSDVCL